MDKREYSAPHKAWQMRYPGEPLWRYVKFNGQAVDCTLNYDTESGGWIVLVYESGGQLCGRHFMSKEDAVRWAQAQRDALNPAEDGDTA